MNIWKEAKEAIFGAIRRARQNIKKINTAPVEGAHINDPDRMGRSTFNWGKNGKRYRNKMQQYEIDCNRWKYGGTGSAIKFLEKKAAR